MATTFGAQLPEPPRKQEIIQALQMTCAEIPVPQKSKKKADVGEHLFFHVGSLFNEPPGSAGLSFT